MAEFVEIDLEKSLGELHSLLDIDLFDKSEISKIYEQRRSISYSLQKKTKEKEDFLRLFRYEEELLKRIANKREKTGNTKRIPDIDGKITNRLVTFFRHTLERYKADVELWKEYFYFCERHRLKRTANKMLTRMMQVHGDKPDLWIFASRWVVNRAKNTENDVESGRVWLVRGIERHPENQQLYKELIKYDLDLSLRDEEKREVSLACAAVSFNSALKNITDPKYNVELLKMISEYPHAEDLNKQSLSIIEAQAECEESWNELAMIALKKTDDNFNSCLTVYEKSVEKLPTKLMWQKFAGFLKDYAKENPFLSVKLYKNVLPAMMEQRFASEEEIALLADYKSSHGKPLKALDVLKTGQEIFPNSCIIVYEYVRTLLTIGEKEKAVNEFSTIVKRLETAAAESVARIWTMIINFLTQQSELETVEKLFKNCINGRIDIAQIIKPKYLQFRFNTTGINDARDLLKNPKIIFPPCRQFYQQLIEIETNQVNKNTNFIRTHYETLSRNFGKNDAEIWLDWIGFERVEKNYERMTKIYATAMANLRPSEADNFSARYSLEF